VLPGPPRQAKGGDLDSPSRLKQGASSQAEDVPAFARSGIAEQTWRESTAKSRDDDARQDFVTQLANDQR
jgi:hypothetical protein